MKTRDKSSRRKTAHRDFVPLTQIPRSPQTVPNSPRISRYSHAEILLTLMLTNSSKKSAQILGTTVSSISHYLAHRNLSYLDVKLIQTLAGTTCNTMDTLINIYKTNSVSRPVYARMPATTDLGAQYYALLTTPHNNNQAFLLLAKTIAAMSWSLQLDTAAMLLGVTKNNLSDRLTQQQLNLNYIQTMHLEIPRLLLAKGQLPTRTQQDAFAFAPAEHTPPGTPIQEVPAAAEAPSSAAAFMATELPNAGVDEAAQLPAMYFNMGMFEEEPAPAAAADDEHAVNQVNPI